MATAALIPVEEYLTTSYHPDVEYVDGVLEERAVGELDHGDLQKRLSGMLERMEHLGYFRCAVEYRLHVSSTRFRVPDLALRRKGIPREQVGRTPPILCIEILSPEDRTARTMVKVREYLTMGVLEVWVLNPESRSVLVCGATGMTEHFGGLLTIPTTPVSLDIAQIFSVLDED